MIEKWMISQSAIKLRKEVHTNNASSILEAIQT